MKLKENIIFIVMLGTLLPINSSIAATTTSTFTVTATVAASCTVSASNLAFGPYTLAQLDGTSTITVTCTNGTPYTIFLNPGTAPSATTSTRKTTGPVYNTVQQYLPYYLFYDSGRTSNWGATAGSSPTGLVGTGSAVAHTVYGRILAGETAAYVASTTYTDTITVTVNF